MCFLAFCKRSQNLSWSAYFRENHSYEMVREVCVFFFRHSAQKQG